MTSRPAAPDWPPERWAERYAAGAGIRTLMTESGASYGTVHKRLIAAGVVMRPRGGAHRSKRDDRGSEGS